MEIEIIVGGAIVAFALVESINRLSEWRHKQKEEKRRQQKHEESMKEDSNENERKEPDTMGLMFRTLSNLGCQPTKNQDGTISVSYQGENFHMEFDGMYARICNPMRARIKADDLPKIQEAVNVANYNFGPPVVLIEPDYDGLITLHTHRRIMLHPAFPDNEPFVKDVLDSFFDAKEEVRNNYQKINASQMEEQKNRRPVGFATSNPE